MTHRHVALSLTLAGLLLAVPVPGEAQSTREDAALTDLLELLQSDEVAPEAMAAALRRAEAALGGTPPACDPANPMFDDVPADSLFCPFIEELARRGITEGCGNNNFCPGDPLTRAQMATFIVRTLGEAAWHEVGAPGAPEFGHPDAEDCLWGNFDTSHSSAGFLRDGDGFVHLKGLVQIDGLQSLCEISFGSPGSEGFVSARTVFLLPEGFRPERRHVFTVLTRGELGRVTVYSSSDVIPTLDARGAVVVDLPVNFDDADEWVSLDGISFRCDPEEPGCP